MKTTFTSLLIGLLAVTAHGYNVSPAKNVDSSAVARRQALGSIFGGSVAFLGASAANALDMDAFANAQIESDVKNCNPKVSRLRAALA